MGVFERLLSNKSGKKDKFIAGFVTAALVGLLLIAGPALAITLGITDISDTTPTERDTISFLGKIDLHVDQIVALENVTVEIREGRTLIDICTFDLEGNKLTGCANLDVSKLYGEAIYSARPGYGYGYGYSGRYETTPFSYGYSNAKGYGYHGFSDDIIPGHSRTSAEFLYAITYLTPSVSSDTVYTIIMYAEASDGRSYIKYKTKTVSSITVQNSGGGGGGTNTYTVSIADLSGGYTQNLQVGDEVTFTTADGERHTATIIEIGDDYVILEVASTPQTATITIGETKKFELTGDNYYDLKATLNSIANGKASITLESIYELISAAAAGEAAAETETGAGEEGAKAGAQPEAEKAGISKTIIWIIAGIVILAVIAYFYFRGKKK